MTDKTNPEMKLLEAITDIQNIVIDAALEGSVDNDMRELFIKTHSFAQEIQYDIVDILTERELNEQKENKQ